MVPVEGRGPEVVARKVYQIRNCNLRLHSGSFLANCERFNMVSRAFRACRDVYKLRIFSMLVGLADTVTYQTAPHVNSLISEFDSLEKPGG